MKLVVLLIAAQILIPSAPHSRVLTKPTPALLQVSEGIVAEPTPSIGQAAFEECMKTGASLACEPVRASAIRYDAEQRTKRYALGCYDADPNRAETLLTSERLFLVR